MLVQFQPSPLVGSLLAGLLKGVKAEFYAASSREPDVYRGRPFQIEAAIAFGGELAADDSARVIRFANRVPLCRPCHKQIHATFANAELARLYNDLDSLRSAPQLQPFLKWIRKQKADRNFRTLISNEHPKARRRR